MPKITFVFHGEERSGVFDSDTSLLSAAEQLGVPIISTCGGQPSCTDCRVKVIEGLKNLTKPEFDEISLMGSVSHITCIRLSCQAKPLGDVRVEALRLRGEYDKQAREEKLRRRQDRYNMERFGDSKHVQREVARRQEARQAEAGAPTSEPRRDQPPRESRDQGRDRNREQNRDQRRDQGRDQRHRQGRRDDQRSAQAQPPQDPTSGGNPGNNPGGNPGGGTPGGGSPAGGSQGGAPRNDRGNRQSFGGRNKTQRFR